MRIQFATIGNAAGKPFEFDKLPEAQKAEMSLALKEGYAALPAPNGPIYLVMRLYWPKRPPPSILPPGEGTWKPPAVLVAQ